MCLIVKAELAETASRAVKTLEIEVVMMGISREFFTTYTKSFAGIYSTRFPRLLDDHVVSHPANKHAVYT